MSFTLPSSAFDKTKAHCVREVVVIVLNTGRALQQTPLSREQIRWILLLFDNSAWFIE